jgi:hypothetical protein
MAAASEGFGQPVDVISALRRPLAASAEFHFLLRKLSQNGHAVLNAQALNLAMSQIPAKPNELAPRRG